MKSMEKDRQTKIMENDLRILKIASMLMIFFAILAAITPFISPGERLWGPVFMEACCIFQIGWVTRRAISALHKRVSELESRCAESKSDMSSQPK